MEAFSWHEFPLSPACGSFRPVAEGPCTSAVEREVVRFRRLPHPSAGLTTLAAPRTSCALAWARGGRHPLQGKDIVRWMDGSRDARTMSGADDKFDGLFMTVTQQAGGIDPLFESFFGFLRRKTDFYSGAGDANRAETTMRRAFEAQRVRFLEEKKAADALAAKKKAEEEARRKRLAEEAAKKEREAEPASRFEEVSDEAAPDPAEPSDQERAPAAESGAPAADESKGAGVAGSQRAQAQHAAPHTRHALAPLPEPLRAQFP